MAKNLDQELAEVAGVDPGDDVSRESTDAMSVPQPAEQPHDELRALGDEPPRRNLGLLAVLLVMVAGILSLFAFGFEEASIYSMPVEEFLAKGEEVIGRQTRIDGELVPGTLQKHDQPCEYRFVLRANEKHDQQLPVRFPNCVVPDTFRDRPEGGVLVTVEGKLTKEQHFEATTVLAKCSSKYDPETHTLKSESEQPGPATPEPIN